MSYVIFTSAGRFYAEHAPPDDYDLEVWPPVGTIHLRHESSVSGYAQLRMSHVVTSFNLDERPRPDLDHLDASG